MSVMLLPKMDLTDRNGCIKLHEDVKAKYKSGVLTIVLPKKEQKKLNSTSKIAIE